jgi:polysaccharide deacetylase family protein (PEP-CTERM system associated)
MNAENSTIILTFDVEDWFQVENFRQCIPFSSWPNCELRVERNVNRILDLLDSIKLNNSKNPINSVNPKATFFVLGWIAERLPHLVREIRARGHEVASHGYCHKLCKEQSLEDLRMDLLKSKKVLEDVTGTPIYGYRAPSFSINHDILKIVEDSAYFYDSSFNSFNLNKRYGRLKIRGNGHNGAAVRISNGFYELPISNLKIGKRIIPWGGGGYFRFFPFLLFRFGVQSILARESGYLFYLHPWEIDPDQPRVLGISKSFKFRHYVNLGKTYEKLSMLLDFFKEYQFSTCVRYIARATQEPNELGKL